MADTVRASTRGLEIVEQARQRKGWTKSADIWCQSAFTSKATLKRFWERKSIHRDTFIRICRAVGLTNWQDIVEHTQILRTDLDPDFVGREEAIAQLNSMVRQGAKIIVIQGEGGVGKTRLVSKYFEREGLELLELSMATEPQNIVSVESVVEEWLWRDFNEEPGRNLWSNLQRLKRKLRDENRRIGILIDNLETALDKYGQFIESHRDYVELLRVLADSGIHAVTLITSRERLYEARVDVNFYMLEGLDESAWRQFFAYRNINPESVALSEMCRAYGGNAKAMKIISGAILTDFEGDIDAYWRATQDDLLIERELENLVVSQFNRLQNIDLEAYRLLCRLGCYRYQDVPFIPIEGLFCLLWDVPESKRGRVVNRLCDRSLVEYSAGRYWLHPVIRVEAINRLRQNEAWEKSNRKAADFWTNRVHSIGGTKDALIALEAFYHYVVIEDFEQAADVIIRQRNNKWGTNESLGRSFYKRGLLKPMIGAITQILNKLSCGYQSAKLYHTLGAICCVSGEIHKSINYCEKSREIALTILEEMPSENLNNDIITKLKLIEMNSLLTTGICQMDLWELDEAVNTFTQVTELSRKIDYDKYAPSALFYLTFLYSCLQQNQKASELANQLYKKLPEGGLPSWVTEFRLFYLALTYKNLGEIEQSFDICHQIISYAEAGAFNQAKNKALNGLAQLYRERGELETALHFHKEAIRDLDEIGAKGDLAEAHYQLALTYQKMAEIDKSRENFEQAIALFQEMQAPRQVEKVQTAIFGLNKQS